MSVCYVRDSRVTFASVAAAFAWTPIRDCPGRFVAGNLADASPLDAAAAGVPVVEHRVTTAKDAALIAEFERGVFCWCHGCQRQLKSRLKRVEHEADAL
jgi:hypothetical protein